MFCLSGIGGGLEPIIEKTGSASKILAIDGCSLDCIAKLCLQKAGFTEIQHLRVTDLGYEKGQTELSEDAITETTNKGQDLLARKDR